MNRPQTKIPKRPRGMAGSVARTRKEAAMHLVRVEFDAARLELAVEQAENRAETHRQELELLKQRRRALVDKLKD